jgi:DNA-binding beta-propeller fold protein YncE
LISAVTRLSSATLVLSAVLAVLAGPATARAAAPALTPSVVGEAPVAGGVFRFPQAVAFSPGGGAVFVADQYSGVVQSFAPDGTPRAMFGGRATRREPGRLGTVGGVATDKDGRVYVLDSENDRVQVYAAAGTLITSWGDSTLFDLSTNPSSVTAGISASGLAVTQPARGAAPVVYVADQGKNRVDRFTLDPATLDPTGPPVISDPALGLLHPQGIALDPAASRVYVADDDNDRVVVLAPDTLALLAQVGSHGTGPGQFQNPYDVAVDALDQLYVGDNLNNRVDVFDAPTLAFRGIFGGFGRIVGGFSIVRSVGALADDPRGGVDVADTANNRIQALDAAGNVLAAWGIAGRGPGYVTRPGGVAFTPDGGVAVADSFDHRIERFAADGAYAGQLGLISPFNGFATAGSAPGQFDTPRGVAYDPSGNAWVADTANDRVVEESPSGAVLATFPASAPASATADGAGNVFVADTGSGDVLRISPPAAPVVVRSGLTAPVAIAPDGAGGVYVADTSRVLTPDGSTVAPPPPAGAWDHPSGLAYDRGSDTLYVAERRPGTADGARVVRRNAGAWDTVATEGTGAAQVIEPGGLAVSPDGATLAVADTGNNRVVRFDAAGHTPPALPQLSVSVTPITGGMVTSDPLGIACATDCAQHMSQGARVTLTARAATGLVLAGWTGGCAPAGTAPTCTITMAGAQSAGATFALAPPPAAPAAPAPAPPAAAPARTPPVRILSVRVVPSRLHLSRRRDGGRPARRATRARVTVRTTRPASLTVIVEAGRPGVRRGSACVAPPRSGRRGRPCTRFVPRRGIRTVSAPGGVGRFVLTPAAGGVRLAPGRYRLAVTALDRSGNRVGPARASFVVVR